MIISKSEIQEHIKIIEEGCDCMDCNKIREYSIRNLSFVDYYNPEIIDCFIRKINKAILDKNAFDSYFDNIIEIIEALGELHLGDQEDDVIKCLKNAENYKDKRYFSDSEFALKINKTSKKSLRNIRKIKKSLLSGNVMLACDALSRRQLIYDKPKNTYAWEPTNFIGNQS